MTDERKIILYKDFVVGIANNTLQFEIKNKKAFAAIFFDKFIIWVMRFLLFLVIAPFLIIPTLSYLFNNWWLLFGFLGLLFGNTIHGINTKSSKPLKI